MEALHIIHNYNSFEIPKPRKEIVSYLKQAIASEDKLDSQARILIPQILIDYAKIEKEVLILGALKKIEVWNPNIYKEYLEQSNETYEQIAAKVMAK